MICQQQRDIKISNKVLFCSFGYKDIISIYQRLSKFQTLTMPESNFEKIAYAFNISLNVLNIIMLLMEFVAILFGFKPRLLEDHGSFLIIDIGLLLLSCVAFFLWTKTRPQYLLIPMVPQVYALGWTLVTILTEGALKLYYNSFIMWILVWSKFFVSNVVIILLLLGSLIIFLRNCWLTHRAPQAYESIVNQRDNML
jgi:hypothetical protein